MIIAAPYLGLLVSIANNKPPSLGSNSGKFADLSKNHYFGAVPYAPPM